MADDDVRALLEAIRDYVTAPQVGQFREPGPVEDDATRRARDALDRLLTR